ncbi:glycosyltransferase [Fibrobacter succinogenes]|uniref:Glycosyl transferases group 1 n=1 Tax=Fibrobacter succinogenes TaxID=833 RepID=A0A380RVC0_FIBSU|nr:glycosyltransferase [Fibrobacter succinogenes]PWJ36997.1 glycosyl transferase family 1 [Fibrobacter succinogenes subsp. elongatus]SUQ19245.1 Glycosyl transferases group 1 [Fibrobacter succinogenes]
MVESTFPKKKILVINQHFSTGGIKKSLESLLPILMECYDVNVLLLCGSTKEFDEKYPGIRIKTPFFISSGLSSLKDLKEMNLFFLRFCIKILFVYLSKIIGGEKVVKAFITISKKIGKYDCVISYAHDNWSKKGAFFGGGNYLAIKKTESSNKISWVHGEPKIIGLTSKRLFLTYSEFNHVIAVSDAVKSQFETLSDGLIKCEKIYNLINIDLILNKCRNTIYKENFGLFRIVTVGRLSKVAKRIDKVNEIAKKLKEQGYNYKWTVVGDGAEYDSCVKICKEYGLEGLVEYVGNQNNPYAYMKESDLFVLVSDSEAMPLVINEALIVGTPVVTTDFPSAKESVIDGVTGYITGKDVDSLFEKIAFCIEHDDLLKKIRNNIKLHSYNNEESIQAIRSMVG